MEKPQLENGYTRIANEILEKLSQINLSAYQTRILFFLFRKTYGYGKKEDWISISQIVEGVGIHKSHVSRTKKELLLRKLVTSNGNKIAFQKDSRLWTELPKQVTVTNSGQKVTNLGQKLPVQAYTKDNIQKIITKETSGLNEIIALFKTVNPNYELLFANRNQRASLDRMVVKFGREKIINALTRLPSIMEMPYAPRITTPVEFENKFGQLVSFVKQEQAKKGKGEVLRL